MVLLAVAASFAGESAYQLMVDSYSIVLVGLFAPFVMSFGKMARSWSEAAASMLLGVLLGVPLDAGMD